MGEPRKRSQEEFSRDLEAEAPALYAWATARLGGHRDSTEADDFAQEVIVRALRAHRNRSDEITNLRAWLFGIARRTLLELLRARMERRAVGLGIGGDGQDLDGIAQIASSVSRRVAGNDQVVKLLEIVRGLPETDQRIIAEYLIEGRTSEEVATTVGLTDSGVRQAAVRLRALLIGRAPFAADYFKE